MGTGIDVGPEFPAQFYQAISTNLDGCFSEN
jgi:hypothetical protein